MAVILRCVRIQVFTHIALVEPHQIAAHDIAFGAHAPFVAVAAT